LPTLFCLTAVRFGQLSARWAGELQIKHRCTGADLGVTPTDPRLSASGFCPAWGGPPWFSDLDGTSAVQVWVTCDRALPHQRCSPQLLYCYYWAVPFLQCKHQGLLAMHFYPASPLYLIKYCLTRETAHAVTKMWAMTP